MGKSNQKVVAIYDPPYGIDIVNTNKSKGSIGFGGKLGFIGAKGMVDVNAYFPIIGDETTEVAKKCFSITKNLGIDRMIIFGGNYMTDFLPPSSCWIIWDKRVDIPSNNFADCEIAWTSFKKPSRIIRHKWSGLLREGDRKTELIKRVHPTQKPVGMLIEIIKQFTQPQDIVLDLFLGSGSTLIAAEKTGRICYGMEIDERYVDVILKRYEDYTGTKAIKLG